jgi:uncharacterized protein (UPF0332 family)
MATPREHREKALHNERFLEAQNLPRGEFIDWAVTVLFYSALHWMRALAAQEGYQIRSYQEEERIFQLVPTLAQDQRVYAWYRQLKDESRDVRYEIKQVSPADFEDLQQNYFNPFKTFVTSKLLA